MSRSSIQLRLPVLLCLLCVFVVQSRFPPYLRGARASGGDTSANRGRGVGWNQWRGPGRDGKIVARPSPKPRRWPKQLTRRWKVEVGTGHASPLAVGNGVFVFTREDGNEVIRRLDIATGRELWNHRYPAPYEMDPAARGHGDGPKSTPLYHDGNLYTLGISGILCCLDARSGNVRWRHEFSRQFKKTSPLYGAAMSPVAEGGRIIAHVGGHDDGALTAFDAQTGRIRWRWAGDGPAYASPIIVSMTGGQRGPGTRAEGVGGGRAAAGGLPPFLNLGGVRQVVTQTQKMCVGVAAATGELLWSIPFPSPYAENCVTPVAVGETLVFGGTLRPTFACRVRRHDGVWTAEKVWETRDVTLYMSTPVAVGNRLYGLSERRRGQLFCLDAATGKLEWTGVGGFGENAALFAVGQAEATIAPRVTPRGSPAGPLLLALNTGGELCVFQPNGAALSEVARYQVADSPTWASPAILGNRILVKDVTALTLWELPA